VSKIHLLSVNSVVSVFDFVSDSEQAYPGCPGKKAVKRMYTVSTKNAPKHV